MPSLLDLSGLLGGSTSANTPSALNVTVLPGLTSPTANVGVGGLAGVQLGTPTTTGSNLLNANIDLLQGLNLGSGSGSSTSSGTGVTVTTPIGGVGVGLGGASGTGTGGTGTGTGGIGVGVTTPIGGVGVGVGTGTGTGTDGGGTGPGGGAPTALPDAHTAYQNIFRTSAADIPPGVNAQLDTLDQMVASGQITAKQAILQIVHAAAGSTAVAETSYQFFTGLTPESAGLDYLVHSTANANDLNDSYYASFNTENRYINFAANLGLHSDYAPAFASVYGSMTFDGAVRTAYDRIVGAAQAQAAGINPETAIANIEAQLPYFQQIAHERFGTENFDLSTKLAAIAYILEEGVKANVGNYGVADQNFLFDLADGKAQFHVDLVATYGKGTPLDMV